MGTPWPHTLCCSFWGADPAHCKVQMERPGACAQDALPLQLPQTILDDEPVPQAPIESLHEDAMASAMRGVSCVAATGSPPHTSISSISGPIHCRNYSK